MSSKIKLPPNYASLPLIQIAWNGWFRKQCELVKEQPKDCAIILSLVYDPWLKRLRPIEASQK